MANNKTRYKFLTSLTLNVPLWASLITANSAYALTHPAAINSAYSPNPASTRYVDQQDQKLQGNCSPVIPSAARDLPDLT